MISVAFDALIHSVKNAARFDVRKPTVYVGEIVRKQY